VSNVDVSVIIPAYNAIKYIGRAIESIQIQSGLSWELIVVENGSTDDTYNKCLSYADKDNRVKVIQSEKGVSNARNKGLDSAVGQWICFLDADDYLYPDTFKSIADIKEISEVKLIHFGHNSGKDRVEKETIVYNKVEEYLEFRCNMVKNPTQYMTVWGKFFDKDIINNNNLRFDSKLTLAEDSDFTFRYMQCIKNAIEMRTELYHYSRDNESAVRSYNPETAQRYIKAINHTLEYVEKDCQAVKKAYNQYILIHLLLILVHDTFNISNPANNKQKKDNMKKLLATNCFKKAIDNTRISECKGFRMLPVICMKLHMNWAAILMVKVRVYQNNKCSGATK
jgi:glycosyltransferase involved in cell wall biosynthesis